MFRTKSVHLKKMTAVFLAAVCFVTFFGCDNGLYYDEVYVEEYAADNLFENIEPYTEYEELTELNEAIDRIKAVDISYGDDFTGFDILGKVKEEMQGISLNWPVEHDASWTGFDWFDGDTVDVDLLEDRIRQNTANRGIEVTDELAVYIRKTAEACKADIEYIKDNFPGFYFACAFKKVDSLYVDFTSDDSYLGFCTVVCDEASGISYNKNQLEDGSSDRYEAVFYHEVAHLLSQCDHNGIVYNGIEIDDIGSTGAPLNSYYASEFFAKYMESVFVTVYDVYYLEEECNTELWTLSTGVSEYDLANAYVCKDAETVICMLEPELQDACFYFSLFYAFDLWSDISNGEEDSVSDINQFRDDCFRYYYINIIKNAYIRLMKEYTCGEITAEEATAAADRIYSAGYNCIYTFVNNEKLNNETLILCEEKTMEMQTIFDDFITNNSY